MEERQKIAAIITTYFPHSHADVIVTKYMKGFPTDDGFVKPRVELVSMYLDQIDARDIGVDLAEEHNVPIYPSIRKALTLGGNDLAVDGVLLIGEHGDYPHNELEQHMYPRRYMFEQICGVFASSGRSVPVFCDKHLSYNWSDAHWMYKRAKSLDVPFMAGSSLPVCWRQPFLEHSLETELDCAVGIGYGGVESYGFHALETLQCMIERRKGGESGVTAVRCIEGGSVWDIVEKEDWILTLAEAACEKIENRPERTIREGCANPTLFLMEHRDGFKSAVLMLNGYVTDFAYAGKAGENIYATEFYLQNGTPHAHFSYLSLNIEEMFVTGIPHYPVERTLLTTGILDVVMRSRAKGGLKIGTPYLSKLTYQSFQNSLIRPTGPRPSGSTIA